MQSDMITTLHVRKQNANLEAAKRRQDRIKLEHKLKIDTLFRSVCFNFKPIFILLDSVLFMFQPCRKFMAIDVVCFYILFDTVKHSEFFQSVSKTL